MADLGLAEDYLEAANSYRLAASALLHCAGPNHTYVDPISFLLGHSAELVLKSALVFNGHSFEDIKKLGNHEIKSFLEESKALKIALDEDFEFWVNDIHENFSKHDYRYPRVFRGFPAEEHDDLVKLNKEYSDKSKKEMRKHGLVVRSKINHEKFVEALEKQINLVSKSYPVK